MNDDIKQMPVKALSSVNVTPLKGKKSLLSVKLKGISTSGRVQLA